MAVYRGKMLLWDGFTTLTESDERFPVGVPRYPMWDIRPIGIAELRKVRPIGLHDRRELVVGGREWQPAKGPGLKCTKDIWNFEGMEGP